MYKEIVPPHHLSLPAVPRSAPFICSLASGMFQVTYIISVVVNPFSGAWRDSIQTAPALVYQSLLVSIESKGRSLYVRVSRKSFFFTSLDIIGRDGDKNRISRRKWQERKFFHFRLLPKKNHFSHLIKSLTLLTRSSQAAMRFNFYTFALLTGTVTVVNAHFQLAFPPPRGPFDDDNEVNFCGKVTRLCPFES